MTESQNNFEGPDSRWRGLWDLPPDVTYLNHGSFGPSPVVLQQTRQRWSRRLERQPMDFFLRHFQDHLDRACGRLGEFVGADAADLVFVDNATTAMNIVAANVPLETGDEVLLTDHEYGAVLRIWQRACDRVGAHLVVRKVPRPIRSDDELAETFLAGITQKTRLVVASHVTSPTSIILPIEKICRGARDRGVPVCVDGPHALAMLPLELKRLGCDYYAASCHKWLCAPFGTGFLYVDARCQQDIQPVVTSWGRSVGGRDKTWKDEFRWIGTRDPAGFLSVPAAIDFMESIGLETFRDQTHRLAREARRRITQLTGFEPEIPDTPDWYGSMITLPLSPADGKRPEPPCRDPLQDALWERFQIEVPVLTWNDRRMLRVSCHLYNSRADIDRLVDALRQLLP